ncbi:MAG TPA: homocysteine S-methyltransferase family protein [Dehalococcoidia bacterium]|jgi:5-methyltetrahydrofolate--homocysteine methyltransferase|nr:methionine synthase [Chloroflexota bacterium]MDP5876572.1 homocysteine S-methyltransferase family protein [Dehalococcoidia bacterium]MDP7161271.1 homocysteine S-methyltransferase family protein [Dehalococcoidia bacterium]MDP7213156.1 homocysteine S-methyltransferase family protein [Dehalococcoidia bacterium]MDP7513602.1 homocysteine S-methyltransferase family protein [Dehalococcoidia bacterium]|tara:strand:- start:1723 stop:2616 length:894 start_codon:yes stop_codon:yes gene_type:complete
MTSTSTPTFLERLERGDTIISDGATGTYLQENGLEPGGCPEEFNVSHPEIVKNMAKRYFDAGAEMVLTNSFGGSKFMTKKYGFEHRVAEFNRLAAEHARSVAPPGAFVVGSVGPTGEFLEPLGPVTSLEMYDAFVEQITALAEGGADAVVIETMTAIEEATLAVRAAKESTDLIVMSTMVYDPGPRGFFTMMGVAPEDGVKKLRAAGADVVGTNCGNGIERMIEIARLMRAVDDGYMLIHPNAGIPAIVDMEIVYPETPEFMAEHFKTLQGLGINILGGCCGTGPDHIKSLVTAVKG